MPELPEVETTRLGLAPLLRRQTITAVRVRQPRLRWPIPPNLSESLCGQTVHEVARRAKYLLLKLDSGALIVHLGMSGSLRVVARSAPLSSNTPTLPMAISTKRSVSAVSVRGIKKSSSTPGSA